METTEVLSLPVDARAKMDYLKALFIHLVYAIVRLINQRRMAIITDDILPCLANLSKAT